MSKLQILIYLLTYSLTSYFVIAGDFRIKYRGFIKISPL